LRNYSIYILTTIKGTSENGFIIDKKEYTDDSINSILQTVKIFTDISTILGTDVFSDPFLVYLLVISKKSIISAENMKKILLLLIKILPHFWDLYKSISDLVSISEIDEIIKHITDHTMRRVFILYLGSKKSILHPLLLAIISNYNEHTDNLSVYEEGLIASVLGHYKKNTKSIEIMERVLEKTHDWHNLDQFSNILYSLKDSDRLSSLLFKVFDRFGNLPIYNYISGNVLALKSDHISSIDEFQKILNDEISGDFDIAYIFIAQEYFHLKDTCSAIKACNLAIKKNYNDYRVWLSMAQIYFSIEMHEYALHFYRKCAELSPGTYIVYEGLGQCFDKLSREDEAVRCYNKSIEQGSIRGICLLGDLLFRQNKKEYVDYYVEYLKRSFIKKETEDNQEISIKTLERIIETLETAIDPGKILEWRKELTILKEKTGN
jgi:tetratricopeptide (TPR) repeat protein